MFIVYWVSTFNAAFKIIVDTNWGWIFIPPFLIRYLYKTEIKKLSFE